MFDNNFPSGRVKLVHFRSKKRFRFLFIGQNETIDLTLLQTDESN